MGEKEAKKPLPLDYDSRASGRAGGPGLGEELFHLLRRVVFAAGCGLLMAGLGGAMTAGGGPGDPEALMGWGGVLIGLCLPLPRLPFDDPPAAPPRA